MTVHDDEAAAVALAADRVGDRWTLRVVHALLAGPRRFGDLQRQVAPIAPNVLAARLRHLAADGLIVAEPYQMRPARYEYTLAARGRELAGVLRLLAAWADDDLAPVHDACGTRLEVRWRCPTCHITVESGDEGLVRL